MEVLTKLNSVKKGLGETLNNRYGKIRYFSGKQAKIKIFALVGYNSHIFQQ